MTKYEKIKRMTASEAAMSGGSWQYTAEPVEAED